MDAQTILRIKPALTQYLHEFDGCMGRRTNRRHLQTYVGGQLSDLQRKSVEPIADAAGESPRTLQEFLGRLIWDEGAVRDRLQRRVAQRHADPRGIGILDETSFAKKGNHTACVQRQHCGSRGKQDNCVVAVHLGYAAGDFHTLLDGELYLPEKTRHQNRTRCRSAGIPDDVVYRPKWQIGLAQIQRALRNGVRFSWFTFDEGYGGKPPFLRGLEALGQNYVAEIPVSFMVWTKAPEVMYREHSRDRRQGRPRKLPRLKVRNTSACEVRHVLAHSPKLRRVPWKRYRVKEGEKGPMVWEAKCIPVWIKDERGLPVGPYRLLIARNVLKPEEVKFFLSNAPLSASVEALLLVAFSRWRIERILEDSKGELGMDHFEVRRYLSIQRHLILTCVSHLFLAEFRLDHGGKKKGTHDRPGPDHHESVGFLVGPRGTMLSKACGSHRRAIAFNAAAQRRRPPGPSQANHTAITRNWRETQRPEHVSMAKKVA
ncbi:MAG: IS701 family transposase [Gemmatimonadales bacterium]